MMKSKVAIGVAIAIAVIVVAGLGWFLARDPAEPGNAPDNVIVEEVSRTREEVPAGTTVPDANSEVSADVAKPDVVAQAAPGVTSKYRTFKIQIENNEFNPSTVIVNVNDIAHIDFTAVDKAYDVVQPDYGFKLQIAKGETRLLEGQYTSPGKYIFYCESCGGLDSSAKGYVIVVPKQ